MWSWIIVQEINRKRFRLASLLFGHGYQICFYLYKLNMSWGRSRRLSEYKKQNSQTYPVFLSKLTSVGSNLVSLPEEETKKLNGRHFSVVTWTTEVNTEAHGVRVSCCKWRSNRFSSTLAQSAELRSITLTRAKTCVSEMKSRNYLERRL